MYLEQLALSDFRSYASVELDLRPGCSVFVGPNGQGKTNLVEAVGYVATQSSHRAGTDAPLVRQGAPRAVVRAGLVRERRRALVEIEINPGRSNRARVNRAPMARAREALGLLRTVAFAPEDLAMVKGDPSERRRYLDDLLVVRTPRLAGVRADYERVLRQRNALLKSAGGPGRAGSDGLATLESWDAHLAGTGSELLSARLRLVTDLAPLVAKAYDAVAPDGGPTSLAYQSSLGPDLDLQPDRDRLAAAMLARIGEVRGTELDRRVSLVGPHRDDLVFNLGSLPARGYASHGESWSFALALRLAAFELLRTGEDAAGPWGDPVLLLDDVFAELDTGRRRRLAELVAPAEQVLVTAAVPGDVPAELSGDRYDVADGEVTRAR